MTGKTKCKADIQDDEGDALAVQVAVGEEVLGTVLLKVEVAVVVGVRVRKASPATNGGRETT